MKFTDLTDQQILELFDSAPLEDLNFLHKFYKTYKNVVLSLVEAFSGYALQKDLFEVYNRFYGEKTVKYSMFSKILKEMEEENLIGSLNGNPKTVFLKAKAYKLMGLNQSTVHHSRLHADSVEKMSQLCKTHLWLDHKLQGRYHPRYLKQSDKQLNLYYLKLGNVFYGFLFCKERGTSEALANDIKRAFKNIDWEHKREFNGIERVELLIIAENVDLKRYKTAIKNVKTHRDFAYRKDYNILKFTPELTS